MYDENMNEKLKSQVYNTEAVSAYLTATNTVEFPTNCHTAQLILIRHAKYYFGDLTSFNEVSHFIKLKMKAKCCSLNKLNIDYPLSSSEPVTPQA